MDLRTYFSKVRDFSVLVGETLTGFEVKEGEEEVKLATASGRTFKLYHEQDCCEDVWLAEIIGDPTDLLGHPLLVAEERIDEEHYDRTYTFYEFRTIKGSVTLRWIGESNGFYSQKVDFVETT